MKLLQTLMTGMRVLPVLSEAATPVSTKTRNALIKQEVQQGNIGASLGRVARQLDLVIAEYDRNGLEGDDVDTLKRFRGMLNNLTQSEVIKIVKQLEAGRWAADLSRLGLGARRRPLPGTRHVLARRCTLCRQQRISQR